jgi:DNA-binding NarL/FixJ family response regulator
VGVYGRRAASRGPDRNDSGQRGIVEPTRVVVQTAEQDVRVLLVDDHRLVRQVLARVIHAEPDIEVVGEGSNGQEALELTRQLVPDVILISVRLPVLNGVDATRAILAEFPRIHVIGMTLVDNGAEAQAIREAGATACVSKSGPMEDLTGAIRDCHPKKGAQVPRRE